MSGNKDQGRAEVHEARLTALTMFSSPETRPQDESLVAAKKFAWKLAVSQRSASERDLVTLEPRKVQWTYPRTGDVRYRSWIDRQIERLTRINRRFYHEIIFNRQCVTFTTCRIKDGFLIPISLLLFNWFEKMGKFRNDEWRKNNEN